jgi:hypothetical protein
MLKRKTITEIKPTQLASIRWFSPVFKTMLHTEY